MKTNYSFEQLKNCESLGVTHVICARRNVGNTYKKGDVVSEHTSKDKAFAYLGVLNTSFAPDYHFLVRDVNHELHKAFALADRHPASALLKLKDIIEYDNLDATWKESQVNPDNALGLRAAAFVEQSRIDAPVVLSNPYKELRKALKAHKLQKQKLKLIKRTKNVQEPAAWPYKAIDQANAALDLYEAEIRELCQLIASTDHE